MPQTSSAPTYTSLAHFKSSLITALPKVKAPFLVENLWEFQLNVKPSQIWPYLIDTSKMNKDLGLPPWKEITQKGELHASTVTLGRDQEWIEKPWIWQHERELQNHRVYSKGWMTEQRGVFTVHPTAHGCTVGIYFCWGFRTIFSKALFAMAAPMLKKKFAEFFKSKEALISASSNQMADLMLAKLEERKKIAADQRKDLKELFSQEGVWTEPLEKFLEYLLHEDELDLDRIHLKKVAGLLKVDIHDLFEATAILLRHGLLSLTWDVICPHCRGATASEVKLAEIQTKNNCEACEVEFSIDQEESVEIVFHLTEKLRTIPKQVYCAAEPAKKKHIKLFQNVAGRTQRKFDLNLPPGRYRLRAKKVAKLFQFEVSDDATNNQIQWDTQLGNSDKLKLRSPINLQLENSLSEETYITAEEAWWFRDHLFPGEVLSSPALREFFSKDHLNMGVKLNVGNQVLVFTDIVGSTPMYKEVGDARAFTLVQKHYTEISQLITENDGVIVKFIGDAVMASFLDMEAAFRACVQIHQKFSPERTDSPIKLRVSMHRGPVLCANLNVGLDFFGTTVNNAAKIQKWANAHQIAVLPEVWDALKGKFASAISQVEMHDDSKLGLQVQVLTVKSAGK